MFRLLLVTLTIFATLICPLRCSGGFDVGRTVSKEGVKTASGCRCSQCRSRRTTPSVASKDDASERVPSRPPDDCGCGNCLCQGAVTTPKADPPATTLSALWVDALPICDDEATRRIAAKHLLDEDVRSHVWRDGRAVRHAIQSLLN